MKIQIPINLAYEDILSGFVLTKILEHVSNKTNKTYVIGYKYFKNGNGYLKRNINAFNNAAKAGPFIVLTDLDTWQCPFALVTEWLSKEKHHTNFIFRVAVTEVEAWLLADAENLSKYFGISETWSQLKIESIADPKAFLINLAKKSSYRVIRDSIVPAVDSTAKVGKDYNGTLGEFVLKYWDIDQACNKSKSLHKLVNILVTFTPLWP